MPLVFGLIALVVASDAQPVPPPPQPIRVQAQAESSDLRNPFEASSAQRKTPLTTDLKNPFGDVTVRPPRRAPPTPAPADLQDPFKKSQVKPTALPTDLKNPFESAARPAPAGRVKNPFDDAAPAPGPAGRVKNPFDDPAASCVEVQRATVLEGTPSRKPACRTAAAPASVPPPPRAR